jgi:hypothetical protein
MGNTAAHLTSADHADFLDFDCHPENPIVGSTGTAGTGRSSKS